MLPLFVECTKKCSKARVGAEVVEVFVAGVERVARKAVLGRTLQPRESLLVVIHQ